MDERGSAKYEDSKVGGRPVIYEIDCRKMLEDGHVFYLSANQIWLTKAVPAVYLKKL